MLSTSEKRKEYHRQYRKLRCATDPAFLERTRERGRHFSKLYRERHPGKARAMVAAANKKWYRKPTTVQYLKAYRKSDDYRERKRLSTLRRNKAVRWRNILGAAKMRAKEKKLEYSLSKEWAEANWTGTCAVTGAEFIYDSGRGPFSPSIDRIDSSLGYTPQNCRFVLWAVNRFKGENSDDDMLIVAKLIVAAMEARKC